MTNNNTRTADIDDVINAHRIELRGYYCHGCNCLIGVIHPDGTLSTGNLRLVNCDALCPRCGEVVHWRRDDVSLENLKKRLTRQGAITKCGF